jgi:hypothetical protein
MRVLIVGLMFALLQPPIDQNAEQQERQPLRSSFDEPFIKVRLFTLASDLDTLGGRRVQVSDLRIAQIVSPQAFVVRMRTRDRSWDSPRGLVLLPSTPARPIVEGVEVEVVGRAYTLAGANIELGWPADLTSDAVKAFDRVPVIDAETVRSGNVELYRRPSSKSSTNPAAARK